MRHQVRVICRERSLLLGAILSGQNSLVGKGPFHSQMVEDLVYCSGRWILNDIGKRFE